MSSDQEYSGLDDLGDPEEPVVQMASQHLQLPSSVRQSNDSGFGKQSFRDSSSNADPFLEDSGDEANADTQTLPSYATANNTKATAPAARRDLRQSRKFVESIDTQLHEADRRVARVRQQVDKEDRALKSLRDQERQLYVTWQQQQERSQRAEAADLQYRQKQAELEFSQQQSGLRQNLTGTQPAAASTGALYESAAAPAARALLKIEQQITLVRELIEKQDGQFAQQQQLLRLAERERDLLLMHHEKLQESKVAIRQWEEQEGAHAVAVGVAQNQHLKKVVRQQATLDRKLASRIQTEAAEHQAHQEKLAAAGATGLRNATLKMAQIAEHAQALRDRTDMALDKEYLKRTQDVMNLKQNIAGVNAEIQAGNERRTKKLAAKEAARANERADIMAAGGNPEAVFRAREVRESFQKMKQEWADRHKRTEVDLMDKLMYEQGRKHVEQQTTWDHTQFMEEQMKTVGREVVNRRREDYMKSKTIGGKDMIDPTSRLPHLYPSDHTAMKDWTFGLGLNPNDTVLKREQAKYPHVSTSTWLVPEELTEDEARAKLRPAYGARPSSNLQGSSGLKDQPQFPAFPGSEASLPRPDAEERERVRRERAEAELAAAKEAEKRRKAEAEAARAAASSTTKLATKKNDDDGLGDGPDPEDTEPVDLGPDEPGKPRIPKIRARDGVFVELTAHEQRKLAEAKELMKTRLAEGEPKEVCGKVYGGSKFLSSPAEIVFQDFEVGVQMEQTIVLTNVSFAFNHFKLLDLPPTISDFFEIIYTRPGRMSAGLTCSLRIIFRPERYEDIDTSLPFLAETGPFYVPLKAITKKLIVSLNPRLMIDFGVVVQGEERQMQIQVKNEGGLDGEISLHLEAISVADAARTRQLEADAEAQAKLDRFSMKRAKHTAKIEELSDTRGAAPGASLDSDSDAEVEPVPESDPLSHPDAAGMWRSLDLVKPLLTLPPNPYIKAYNSTTLPLTFHPSDVGSFEVRCVVTFRPVNPYDIEMEKQSQQSGNGEIYVRRVYPTQVFHILLTGVSTAVPIYLARSTIDYQSVLHGQLYRDVLHVHNRSQRTLSIDVKPPSWCGDALTCEPMSAYVQGGGVCVVQWRLNTSDAFWAQCVKWNCADPSFSDSEEQRMLIKLRLNVPEQVIPVMFELKAHLNNPELELIPLVTPPPPLTVTSASLAGSRAVTVSGSRPGTVGANAVSLPVEYPSSFAGTVSTLQFGHCFLGQASVIPIQIKNHSSLLQKFAFAALPKDYDAQPADGLVTLLPHSSAVRNIVFAPTAAVERVGDVVIRSSLGKEYRIRAKGEGRVCPCSFSHSTIIFPPCPDQQEQLASVFVTNNTSQTQWLEFAAPPADSFLKITPSVLNLPAQQTVRVQVEFCPKVFQLADIPVGGHAEPCLSSEEEALVDSSDNAVESSGAETARSSAPLSSSDLSRLHMSYLPRLESVMSAVAVDRIPLPEPGQGIVDSIAAAGNMLAVEQALSSSVRYQVPAVLEAAWKKRQQPAPAAAVDAEAEPAVSAETAVEPSVSVETSVRPASPSSLSLAQFPYLNLSRHGIHRLGCYVTSDPAVAPELVHLEAQTTTVLPRLLCEPRVADFGLVAIGRAEVMTLTLRNLDSQLMNLSLEPLPSASPFMVLSAVKPVPSGQSLALRVEFRPKSEQPFNDELTFRAGNTQLSVRLSGRGVAPRVALEPPGPVIDVGDAMAGETISSSFAIRNLSQFPLPFDIVTRKFGERNRAGFQEFHFAPSEGVVPPESACTVQVYFSPDHQSEHFGQLVKVEVPNGTDAQLLQFVARGWDRQVYLCGGDESPFATYTVPALNTVKADAPPSTDMPADAPIVQAPSPLPAVSLQDPFSFLGWEDVSVRQVTVTFDPAPFIESKDAAADKKAVEERTRTLVLGACRAGEASAPNVLTLFNKNAKPAAGAAGSFAMELAPEAKADGFFSVEPASGNVAAGQRQNVTVKFNIAKYRGSRTSLVSHWAQTKIKCILKGGLASNGKAEETVEMLCRLFMEC